MFKIERILGVNHKLWIKNVTSKEKVKICKILKKIDNFITEIGLIIFVSQ